MTLPLINNQEGGTDGVTVTGGSLGNSGGDSGSYFNGVVGNVTFSKAHPGSGTLGLKCTQDPTSAGQAKVAWTSTQVGTLPSGTVLFGRLYLYWPSMPATTQSFFQATSAGVVCWTLRVDATGHVVIQDQAGTVIYTSSNALPTGTLIRIEHKATVHATTGHILLKAYYDDGSGKTAQDATTEVFALGSDVANQAFRGSVDAVNHGLISVSAGNTLYVSELEVNTTGWPGPSGSAAPADWYRMRSGAWTGAGSLRHLSAGAWVG